MKRYLQINTMLPEAVNSWGRKAGHQTEEIQMKKLGLKPGLRELLVVAFLMLVIPFWISAASAQTVSQTWTSGSSFTVPAGVYSISIWAVGGAGGSGGQDCGNGCGVNPGAPGGYTSSTFSVTPGTSLSIYIGSNGGNGGSNVTSGAGGGSGGSGYASGGTGGGVGPTGASGGGGGGGGASAVIGTGVTLIAGGGGGGGGRCNTAGSGSAGSTSTGGSGSTSGANGTTPNIDGGGTGAGGGGATGGSCGSAYDLNGEKAANGGNSGTSSPSGSTSTSSPYVTISYTAVGGTASASSTTVCSGGTSTISLSGWAGTYHNWYYSTNGSNYYYYGSSAESFTTGALTTTTYYKADVNGVWSSVATVSIYALTSAPSSASCGGTTASTASLSWGSGSGQGTLTYYWVVGTSSGVTHPSPGNNGTYYGTTTGTTGSASGLSANTTYYLRVYANAACGNSGYTNSAGFMTVPLAPVANTQTNVRANSFTANWTASVGGASSYYLDVSTSATFASFISGYNNKSVGNVNTYSLSGLNRNTTYYYRIRAYNSGGQSVNQIPCQSNWMAAGSLLILKKRSMTQPLIRLPRKAPKPLVIIMKRPWARPRISGLLTVST